MRHQFTPTEVDRFWSKVDRSAGPDACWLWMESTRGHMGYGGFYRDRAADGRYPRVGAHRVAYEITNGPIPEGFWVLHQCDVPRCCNPAHLFLGTTADNVADRQAKGRHSRTPRNAGSANGQSRLTEDDVRRIRRLAASGMTQQKIADMFGVYDSHICAIVKRKAWRHVA